MSTKPAAPARPIAVRYTKARPCPVCGSGTKGCSRTDDDMQICRGATSPPGWKRLTREPDAMGFHHYRPADGGGAKAAPEPTDWAALTSEFAAALTPVAARGLARALGLPLPALRALPVGWNDAKRIGPVWTFPEVDAAGAVIGITQRVVTPAAGAPNKLAMAGGRRGLTIPRGWADHPPRPGPVLVVEGASDALALWHCGCQVVGRPAAAAGAEMLAELLAGETRPACILAENDRKPDGSWPGKAGAESVAKKLAESLGRSVWIAFPPDGWKDARAWVLDLAAGAGEGVGWPAIGEEVRRAVQSSAVEVKPAPDLTTATATAAPAPLVDDELDVSAVPWPDPLGEAAYHGLAGRIVRDIEPQTEADPVAILAQFLVSFGNMVDRRAYVPVEASRHYPALFAVLVGRSARARKGTSWQRTRAVLDRGGDADWASKRIVSGLSSGEGLIWEVRDRITKRVKVGDRYEEQEVEAAVEDKRVLVLEEEFARVLQLGKREGNILDSVIRNAWDTGSLGALSKNTPTKATGAHISIISHITKAELLATIASVSAHNGFLNRFLWIAVRRSKLLPHGGAECDVSAHASDLEFAWRHARAQHKPVPMTDSTRSLWAKEYPRLTAERQGLHGAVTSRAEAQALRLSLVYALLDQSDSIDVPHLEAGLAVEKYVEQSAKHIFGEAVGDPVADEIRSLLVSNPAGVTQTQIVDYFGRHKPRAELERALRQLVEAGLAVSSKTPTGGRPVVLWKSCEKGEPAPAQGGR